MQKIFFTNQSPDSYTDIHGKFPPPPGRCPNKSCNLPVVLKKHGFYERHLILKEFLGLIKIRRYKCPVCGKTLSMLPSFCVPGFQYGAATIINLLQDAIPSVKSAEKKWSNHIAQISRRHITFYLKRLRENRGLLQYGINQMSPDFISLKCSGDDNWTKDFLKGIEHLDHRKFNADFHAITAKSFLSLQNIIA